MEHRQLFVYLIASVLVGAVHCFTIGALPTEPVQYGVDPQGWTPKPTPAPQWGAMPHDALLVKRDFNSVCGYVGGYSADAVTCDIGYCGFNTYSSAFGCCTSVYSSGGQGYLTGCEFFSSCLNYDTSCDQACQLNTGLQACTSSEYPYCALDVYEGGSFSNWACAATNPGATPIEVFSTYTDGSSATAGGDLSTSSSALIYSSSQQSYSPTTTSYSPVVSTSSVVVGQGSVVPQQSTASSNPTPFFPSQQPSAQPIATISAVGSGGERLAGFGGRWMLLIAGSLSMLLLGCW